MITATSRRAVLLGGLGMTVLGAGACSATSGSSGATASGAAVGTTTSDAVAALADVAGAFEQFTYADTDTGLSLPYNLYLPDGYDSSGGYPLVLYIADSSLVGQDVSAPLSQYGALVWASADDQAEHECFVLVPEFPEVVLDDHGEYTTTDYVELTRRLVEHVVASYPVDAARVYGTGQSMGCMTVMYLAATHPDLFTATLLVSGQWDPTVLDGLTTQKFVYVAAAGDENASGGQVDVEQILTDADVPFATATLDATWADTRLEEAVEAALADDDEHAFLTFAAGTVLTANPVSDMEHMASFEPAYKLTAARRWLLARS